MINFKSSLKLPELLDALDRVFPIGQPSGSIFSSGNGSIIRQENSLDTKHTNVNLSANSNNSRLSTFYSNSYSGHEPERFRCHYCDRTWHRAAECGSPAKRRDPRLNQFQRLKQNKFTFVSRQVTMLDQRHEKENNNGSQ